MKQYFNVLRRIMTEGHDHVDRTLTGRRSIFGVQARFDLTQGLPIVTTRGISIKAMKFETLWFIGGKTDVKLLQDDGVKIWNKWAVADGDVEAFALKYSQGDPDLQKALVEHLCKPKLNGIGPMYGAIWRNAPQPIVHKLWPTIDFKDIPSDKIEGYKAAFELAKSSSPEPIEIELEDFCKIKYFETVDQLNDLVINLKKRPFSSRHVVSAWIPALIPFENLSPQENVFLERGSLAPCHMTFQCFVNPPKEEGGKLRLSLLMYQRSTDTPIGAPYNIGQYSMLLAMLAHVTDMEAYEFIWTSGDTHIYLDQKELVLEQLEREPLPLPKLWLNPEVKDLFAFTAADIDIIGYQHQEDEAHGMPVLKYPLSM